MNNGEGALTVEKRLDQIGRDLRRVADVQTAHGEELRRVADVQTSQGEELRKLRVLYEHHDTQIQQIAEVQGAHGVTLDQHGRLLEDHGTLLVEIKDALRPLPEIRDFVKRIAGNHEARIAALEKGAP